MKDFLTFFVIPMCSALGTLVLYEGISIDYRTPVIHQRDVCERYLDEINAPRSKYCHVFVTYEVRDSSEDK